MNTPVTQKSESIEVTLHTPHRNKMTFFRTTIPLLDPQERMLAPLYAELLKRGTTKKHKKEFAAALETLGADIDISEEQGGITFDCRALTKTLPEVLLLLQEMISEPVFSQKEIVRLHAQYLQSLHEEKDDARACAYRAFTQEIYPLGHPYRKETIAERKKFLTLLVRKNYFDLHKNLFERKTWLTVIGPKKAQAQVIDFWKKHTSAKNTAKKTLKIPTLKKKEKFQSIPSKTNVELYIGNIAPLKMSDPQYLPFIFGLNVLGKWGGFSGRLMSTVREKEGLTYSIYTRTEGLTTWQTGMWYVLTFFTSRDLSKGMHSTKREITKIIEKGVTDVELGTFKELLINQFILLHESHRGILSIYHKALCSGMSAEDLLIQYESLKTLTKKEVNTALRTYLNPELLVVSGAGPVDKKGKPLE